MVRRLIVLVLATGAVAMAMADLASADTTANVSIQGSGRVVSNGTPTSVCDRGDVPDNATVPCGTTTIDESGPVDLPTLFLTATPRSGVFVRWEGCDGVTGNTCAFPFNRFENRTVAPKAVFDRAPTVTLGAPSYSDSAERTVSFPSLAADEGPVTFECSVDGGASAPCAPATAFTLAEGSHEVRARARDAAGNVGVSGPAGVRILDTQLASGPPDFAASTSATFRVSSLTGATFDCSLDGAAFAACGTKGADGALTRSVDNLAQGAHTFRVRARDGGDFDRVPAARTWTVDTVAPDTALDPALGPRDGEVTTLLAVAFGIGANEPATLQCRLAPADFAPCGAQASFGNLAFAQHRFEARAIDRAGNVDASPAGRTFTVTAVDRDGDGIDQRADCNDNDANVRPGRREVPGNAVDEDCDGVALPFPTLRVGVSYNFRVSPRSTTFTRLQVKDVPRGATVKATCAFKRSKCPGKARTAYTLRRAAGTVSLDRRYKGVPLKVGTKVTVTVTQSGSVGAVKVIEIRRSRAPKVTDRCLPPGAPSARACPRVVTAR